MKKIILISTLLLATGLFSARAQEVTKDSISTLKQEKDDLKIKKRLNDNKLELAKLQNMVGQKTNDVSSTEKDAQDAAANNQDAAEKLNSNPQDRKLARESKKSSRQAKNAARDGRNATKDLEKLNRDIERLKKQIAEDEAKLGITPSTVPTP